MFDCWYDNIFIKCCVSFIPNVMESKPSNKFSFHLVIPQNIFPHFSWRLSSCFWQSLCLFLSAVVVSLESPMDAIFSQFLSYWIMNFDLNWEAWGLQFVRCCSWFFCDLLVESSIFNFGRFHHSFKFSSFVKDTWEPWCYGFWDLLANFTFSHRFCLN